MSKTRVLRIDYTHPGSEAIETAARALERGEIVIAPTETRYGMLVRADDKAALDQLFRVKGRATALPTAIFVADVHSVPDYARPNKYAETLSRAFLPGPMTLVVEAAAAQVAPCAVGGKIGLRVSSAPVIRLLLDRVGFPMSATSANRSGAPESDTMEELVALFGDQVSVYLDAGPLTQPVSTVVDCTVTPPQVVRRGAVATEEIIEALRDLRS